MRVGLWWYALRSAYGTHLKHATPASHPQPTVYWLATTPTHSYSLARSLSSLSASIGYFTYYLLRTLWLHYVAWHSSCHGYVAHERERSCLLVRGKWRSVQGAGIFWGGQEHGVGRIPQGSTGAHRGPHTASSYVHSLIIYVVGSFPLVMRSVFFQAKVSLEVPFTFLYMIGY